ERFPALVASVLVRRHERRGYMGGLGVSRQRARTVAVAVLVVLLGGCAAATTDEASETQRLQARAAYERAVRSFDDKQPAAALTAAQEAVALEPDSALYHDLLGLVFNELLRPEL